MSKTQDIMTILHKRQFAIPVDEEGELKYVICRVTRDNFVDLPESFIKQLKEEGKYGWYTSFFTRANEYSIDNLAVYGDKDRWVTKWLKDNAEDIVQSDLRDKWMNLYNRIMKFEENKDLL